MTNFRRTFAAAALVCLSACSTYDFSQALRPDGTYDTKKLIADLEASGKDCLDEGIWIPLIYMDFVSFEKTRAPMAEGYHLFHLQSYGPLFCAGSRDEQIVDKAAADIEHGDREWVGWGILYHDRDDYVDTTHGTRHEKHERFALLFGHGGTSYTKAKP